MFLLCFFCYVFISREIRSNSPVSPFPHAHLVVFAVVIQVESLGEFQVRVRPPKPLESQVVQVGGFLSKGAVRGRVVQGGVVSYDRRIPRVLLQVLLGVFSSVPFLHDCLGQVSVSMWGAMNTLCTLSQTCIHYSLHNYPFCVLYTHTHTLLHFLKI